MASCPTNYFAEETPIKTCKTCSVNCATCTDDASTSCLTCKAGFYYKTDTKECLSGCPINYFAVESPTKLCTECHTNCSTCTSAANGTCSACRATFYHKPDSTECIPTCQAGYYPKETPTKECLACFSNCATCTGATNGTC